MTSDTAKPTALFTAPFTAPLKGGCLCGKVRYELDRKFLNAMHCHCSMCQRVHGGAYSTHLILRKDQLSWLSGKEMLVAYESSKGAFREFCGQCGSQLLIHGQTGDGTLSIPAGTLDGDPTLTELGHMFVDDRLSWATPAEDAPEHREWPPGLGLVLTNK